MITIFGSTPASPLLEAIEKAREECREAEMMLTHAEPDFIDHAVNRINAARSQFEALIRTAKKQRVQAWPELQPVAEYRPEEDEEAANSNKTSSVCAQLKSFLKGTISR
ncbi:MAG: DUF2508 family protein [Bacillota bacterium]